MHRIHRAWFVAATAFAVLLAAASFRSTTGVLLEPLENEFGWTRGITSGAVSLNLALYGLTAPFAAAFMQRFQMRQVVATALLLVTFGSAATVFIHSPWQLYVTWGLAIGFGTGSMAVVFGAIVANRWFVKNRSLVTGIFSAASATGQLIFLPLFAWLAEHQSWRYASLTTASASLVLVPFVWALLRDRPADIGLVPYGADASYVSEEITHKRLWDAASSTFSLFRQAVPSSAFWILMGSFFVCGWTTNGLIQTHFVPAAHDHGMPATTAASLIAFVGVFDLIGTIASGWLTDRVNPRYLLIAYYGLRGLALLSVPVVLGPGIEWPLLFFIVFYGLDWVATVPPTVQLCREAFGLERSGILYGWVFASHMVGAGVAASFSGWIRQTQGDYSIAWFVAAALALAASASIIFIPKGRAKSFAQAS
jgi:MFS family permease